MFLDISECFQTFPSRLARTRSTTQSSSTSSYRWPLQGGLPSLFLFSNERKIICLLVRWSASSGRRQLASMILLMPSGLSVECRNWMAVERFIQRILRSIFSSLHYSAPRYFTPCSFPPHQTKRFPSPNFTPCYLFFPPFFTPKKSPLLSFSSSLSFSFSFSFLSSFPSLSLSSFIFCVLCHFYRSTLCVCVLKYIFITVSSFTYTGFLTLKTTGGFQ